MKHWCETDRAPLMHGSPINGLTKEMKERELELTILIKLRELALLTGETPIESFEKIREEIEAKDKERESVSVEELANEINKLDSRDRAETMQLVRQMNSRH